MSPFIPARAVNVCLRAATLGCKFLLIFVLARLLEPAEVGLYGLIVATIGYALYLLGFDFYTFTTREILRLPASAWGGLLKDQAALTLILYGIFLPLLCLVFSQGLLPWRIAGWFFVLLVLEHLTQEAGRLLIALSAQLAASLVLFLRAGAWALAVAALMWTDRDLRQLEVVFAAWTLGGLAALLVGLGRLRGMPIGGWQRRVDWGWIVRGLKVAVPLLLATLSLRGLFTLDRYWQESLAGLDALGAYVLYMGIANALIAFLDAGVFAYLYPALIRAFNQADTAQFRQGTRRLMKQTLLLSLIFCATALILVGPLLGWLDKPVYFEQQALFPWILAAIFLYALGMVPHYALYAQGHDSPLIWSHFGGLLCFILATWLSSAAWPQIAVPLGLCAGFLSILVWKTMAYFRMTPVQYRLGRVSRHTN